jgi:hypothetical protein
LVRPGADDPLGALFERTTAEAHQTGRTPVSFAWRKTTTHCVLTLDSDFTVTWKYGGPPIALLHPAGAPD